MVRTKTPDGKRVVYSVRVSEAKAAAIEAARGDLLPAQWLEAAVDMALAAGTSTGNTAQSGGHDD